MRTYTFYLYDDEGALLGSSSQALESDDAARGHAHDVFFAYPGCEEIEVWEAPRYVAQGRRTRVDVLAPAARRRRVMTAVERSRLLH